jgi:hypothetical protein
MCTNNCNQDPCGCKTSTDEIVYKGPNLDCTGINNCDTLTTAIQKINNFMCSIELVQVIINNIITNVTLYNEFVNVVNNSVDCETVWNCIENTTTTTTTTVQTFLELKRSEFDSPTLEDCCTKLSVSTISVYVDISIGELFNVGNYLYQNALGTIPFDGDYKYWKIRQNGIDYCCLIEGTGRILSKSLCGV